MYDLNIKPIVFNGSTLTWDVFKLSDTFYDKNINVCSTLTWDVFK